MKSDYDWAQILCIADSWAPYGECLIMRLVALLPKHHGEPIDSQDDYTDVDSVAFHESAILNWCWRLLQTDEKAVWGCLSVSDTLYAGHNFFESSTLRYGTGYLDAIRVQMFTSPKMSAFVSLQHPNFLPYSSCNSMQLRKNHAAQRKSGNLSERTHVIRCPCPCVLLILKCF